MSQNGYKKAETIRNELIGEAEGFITFFRVTHVNISHDARDNYARGNFFMHYSHKSNSIRTNFLPLMQRKIMHHICYGF